MTGWFITSHALSLEGSISWIKCVVVVEKATWMFPKVEKTCKTHMVIKNSNQKLILQCKLIAKVWIIIIKSKKLSSLMEYLKCICLKYFRNNLLNRLWVMKKMLTIFFLYWHFNSDGHIVYAFAEPNLIRHHFLRYFCCGVGPQCWCKFWLNFWF